MAFWDGNKRLLIYTLFMPPPDAPNTLYFLAQQQQQQHLSEQGHFKLQAFRTARPLPKDKRNKTADELNCSIKPVENFASNVTLYLCERSRQNHLVWNWKVNSVCGVSYLCSSNSFHVFILRQVLRISWKQTQMLSSRRNRRISDGNLKWH